MKKSVVVLVVTLAALAFSFGCSKTPEEKRLDYLSSAEKYFSQNKYAEAAIQYQNVLKIAPDDAQTLIKLGEIQMLQQKPGDAFGSFMKATKVDPKNINAHSNLATIYLLAKKYDEAKKQADILLSIDPDNIRGKEILAQALFLSGNKDKALKMLKELIAKGDASEGIFVDASQILLETGNLDDGLNTAAEGIKKFPASADIRMVACNIYLAKNQLEDARRMAEEAYSISKGDINPGIFLASFALKNNMPDIFNRVISDLKKRFPDDYRIYLLEADIAKKGNNSEKAIALAKRAVELNNSEQTASFLAELYAQKGDASLAVETLNKAITKFPSSVSLKIILARILLSQNDSEKALQTLDPLIKSMPENPEVVLLSAKTYLIKGEPEKARSIVEKASRDNPDDPSLHAMLASIYFKISDYRGALKEVEITHKIGASSVELLNIGVVSALNLKQADKALKYIQILKKAAPKEWATAYAEITYFLSVNDNKSAFRLSEKAIKQWPDNINALTIYAQTGPDIIGRASTIQGISSVCTGSKSTNCMLVLSKLYEDEGMVSDALAKIKEAQAKNPDRQDLYYALADFYARNRMVDLAINEYNSILNKKPTDIKSATMLALLLHDKGDMEKAEKTYSYILEKSPSNVIAANNLAWILAQRGKQSDLDKAMDLAIRAKRSSPDDPSIADTLGFIYLKKDMLPQAKDQFLIALQKNPDDPFFNYHMAMALAKEGKNKEAQGYLRTALKSQSFAEKESAAKLLKSLGG